MDHKIITKEVKQKRDHTFYNFERLQIGDSIVLDNPGFDKTVSLRCAAVNYYRRNGFKWSLSGTFKTVFENGKEIKQFKLTRLL